MRLPELFTFRPPQNHNGVRIDTPQRQKVKGGCGHGTTALIKPLSAVAVLLNEGDGWVEELDTSSTRMAASHRLCRSEP